MEEKVRVLMSTYNGEKYLEEQLISIFNQKGVSLSLLVRDDGSTDNTVNLLEKLSKIYGFEYICGSNVGVSESFRTLLTLAGDYQFYAFSDQDDYWIDAKLFNAVTMLKKDKGEMYFSNVTYVDKNLLYLGTSIKHFDNMLFSTTRSNKATGCTIVLSKAFKDVLVENYKPNRKYLHDWFALSLAVYLEKKVCFDNESYIKYRQHESNVIGYRRNLLKRIKHSFSKEDSSSRFELANDMLAITNYEIKVENYRLLYSIQNYKKSKVQRNLLIRYAKSNIIRKKDYFIFRILIFARLY